jgi:hypothetical protein
MQFFIHEHHKQSERRIVVRGKYEKGGKKLLYEKKQKKV